MTFVLKQYFEITVPSKYDIIHFTSGKGELFFEVGLNALKLVLSLPAAIVFGICYKQTSLYTRY